MQKATVEQVDMIAEELRTGPTTAPEEVDVDDLLDQLRTRHSDMQEVHVSEEAHQDGTVLMA